MEFIYTLILIALIVIIFHFIRFSLSRWQVVVDIFETGSEPEGKQIYGIWSEFRQADAKYPLINTLLKVIPTSYGLYLKYDLKYEPIKFYKPVRIPWANISFEYTSESNGYDKLYIEKNYRTVGTLFLQRLVVEEIVDYMKNQGIELNIK